MLKFWKRPDTADDGPAVAGAPLGRATALDEVPTRSPEPETPAQSGARRSWVERLKSGLAKTGTNLTGLFVGTRVDEALFEELESALLMADAGVEATAFLIERLRSRAKQDRIEDGQALKHALAALLVDLLAPLERPFTIAASPKPVVIMMVGVNGAGKTTSVGKLARFMQGQGRTVMLAAGDTFRAAAREQLVVWGERNGIPVVSQESGDPAAVVFDAVASAAARRIDVLIADTAGRLQTQLHLMDELRKVKRVIGKAAGPDDPQPREVLLVIDGNTGQNAIAQVKAFDAAVGLTGLIVTKLDGTAKGGVLAAIARVRKDAPPIPVYFIGIGEGLDDLQPFVARQFVDALLGA